MRHPFIVSFTAWTTVVAVVLSALWLATIEEQIRAHSDGAPRSIGLGVVEPLRDAQAQGRRTSTHGALTSTVEATTPPSSARAQTLAWTR